MEQMWGKKFNVYGAHGHGEIVLVNGSNRGISPLSAQTRLSAGAQPCRFGAITGIVGCWLTIVGQRACIWSCKPWFTSFDLFILVNPLWGNICPPPRGVPGPGRFLCR